MKDINPCPICGRKNILFEEIFDGIIKNRFYSHYELSCVCGNVMKSKSIDVRYSTENDKWNLINRWNETKNG